MMKKVTFTVFIFFYTAIHSFFYEEYETHDGELSPYKEESIDSGIHDRSDNTTSLDLMTTTTGSYSPCGEEGAYYEELGAYALPNEEPIYQTIDELYVPDEDIDSALSSPTPSRKAEQKSINDLCLQALQAFDDAYHQRFLAFLDSKDTYPERYQLWLNAADLFLQKSQELFTQINTKEKKKTRNPLIKTVKKCVKIISTLKDEFPGPTLKIWDKKMSMAQDWFLTTNKLKKEIQSGTTQPKALEDHHRRLSIILLDTMPSSYTHHDTFLETHYKNPEIRFLHYLLKDIKSFLHEHQKKESDEQMFKNPTYEPTPDVPPPLPPRPKN